MLVPFFASTRGCGRRLEEIPNLVEQATVDITVRIRVDTAFGVEEHEAAAGCCGSSGRLAQVGEPLHVRIADTRRATGRLGLRGLLDRLSVEVLEKRRTLS